MKIKISLSSPAQPKYSPTDVAAAMKLSKKVERDMRPDSDYNEIMQLVFAAGHGSKEYLQKMTDIIASNWGRELDSKSRVEKTSIPTPAVPR